MARTPQKTYDNPQDDMAAELLLKDADESLRQDRMHLLWNEWGSTIVGIALMVILGTILGVIWQKWQNAQRVSQTSSLIQYQASQDNNGELKGSYKAIANMITAAEMAASDNPDKAAITQLMEQAADADLPKVWDDMAQWGALRSRADIATENDIKLAVADDMVDFASESNNPYRPLVLMDAALINGENGRVTEAVKILENAINDPLAEITPHLQDRLNMYLELYQTETATQ